ncbi:MAG: hypothetical protein ACW99A_10940 [Candidatus Kariarchaeaceae archaeon]|jgi:ABC-type spermidine/putrescine transport system permease subunit I
MRNSVRTSIALLLAIPVQLLLYLTMNNVNQILDKISVESIFYFLIFAIIFVVIFWVIKAFIDEFNADFNIDEFKTILDKNDEFLEDVYHQEDLDEFT